MVRSSKVTYILIFFIGLLMLSGCALRRDENATEPSAPVGGLPPTLAPLGADSAQLTTTDSTAPTAVQVNPTATLAGGGAVTADGQVAPATSQPAVDLSSEVVTNNNVEAAAVEPESFIPPVEGASAGEPVIVDATAGELPPGGPIAVNPPLSQTTGDYGVNPTSARGGNYIVQPGDTLFNLGLTYNTSVQTLMLANGLASEMIYAGQSLTIPGLEAGYATPAYNPVAAGSGPLHQVAEGETLFTIATRYGSTVEALALANGIAPPYLIYPGQSLAIAVVPGSSGSYNGYGVTHTVTPGETLFFIAQQYGITTQALVLANGISNPNQIQAGQTLTIPIP
jgi:LysM repeat protein